MIEVENCGYMLRELAAIIQSQFDKLLWAEQKRKKRFVSIHFTEEPRLILISKASDGTKMLPLATM